MTIFTGATTRYDACHMFVVTQWNAGCRCGTAASWNVDIWRRRFSVGYLRRALPTLRIMMNCAVAATALVRQHFL